MQHVNVLASQWSDWMRAKETLVRPYDYGIDISAIEMHSLADEEWTMDVPEVIDIVLHTVISLSYWVCSVLDRCQSDVEDFY